MGDELEFDGLSIAPKVFDTMVIKAAQDIEGVACVGVPTSGTSSFFSFLSGSAPQSNVPPVGIKRVGDGVAIAVHVTAFFGYQFIELAQAIRRSVAEIVQTLTGVDVVSVDVFIDALVFPKE